MRGSFVVSLALTISLAGCAMHGPAHPQPQADDASGAVAANFWYAPGRAVICGTSAIIAASVMTMTLGQAYDSASELMHGGCSGPWTVSDRDVRSTVP
jgi:hypothetical protein